MSQPQERILLAYSGDLNTSCILKWLLKKDYEVICFTADFGQEEDFEAVREKAIRIGAKDVIIKDMKQQFVEKFVWPALQMGLIKEDRYLLGTSLARPCIALGLMESAVQRSCTIISHGARGEPGNLSRFEQSCYALNPMTKVIAPWRLPEFYDQFEDWSNEDLLEYAKKNNIPVSGV